MSDVKIQNQSVKFKSNLRYRSYKYSLAIITLVSEFSHARVYRIIGDQLLRSATSIGANIVEAKASSSKKEFRRYYEISLKSANETKYWLCLLRDSRLVQENKISRQIQEVVEISNMLGSSLLTLKGKNKI